MGYAWTSYGKNMSTLNHATSEPVFSQNLAGYLLKSWLVFISSKSVKRIRSCDHYCTTGSHVPQTEVTEALDFAQNENGHNSWYSDDNWIWPAWVCPTSCLAARVRMSWGTKRGNPCNRRWGILNSQERDDRPSIHCGILKQVGRWCPPLKYGWCGHPRILGQGWSSHPLLIIMLQHMFYCAIISSSCFVTVPI